MASTRFSSKIPARIITGDYDNDGATDLLITQNHGPAVLLRNEGGNQNHWLRLSLKGLNDNKSAIGTKVEVFSGGNRQKFEIYGSNGYLGQNSTDIVVGLGDAKEADIVRMLGPPASCRTKSKLRATSSKISSRSTAAAVPAPRCLSGMASATSSLPTCWARV